MRQAGLAATWCEDLAEKIGAGQLRIQIGQVLKLDQIAEAHRCIEENRAAAKSSS